MNDQIYKELLARGLCDKFHMVRYTNETVDAMLALSDELQVRDMIEWTAKTVGYINYLAMRLRKELK